MPGLPNLPRAAFAFSLLLAALSTPFNLILVLYSWSFIATLYGNYFADNNHWAVFLVAVPVHTGAFALVALIMCAAFYRASRRAQSIGLLVGALAWGVITVGVLFLIGPINL